MRFVTTFMLRRLPLEPSHLLDREYALPIDRIRVQGITKGACVRLSASRVFSKVKVICRRLLALPNDPLEAMPQ